MSWKESLKKFFGRKNMSQSNPIATSGYPERVVNLMVEEYQKSPNRDTVEELASEYNKPVRGVIAKLVHAGVYVKQARPTKSNDNVLRKADIVAAIEKQSGVEMPSLEKASKQDLEKLAEILKYVNIV